MDLMSRLMNTNIMWTLMIHSKDSKIDLFREDHPKGAKN